MKSTIERDLPADRRGERFTIAGFVSASGISRSTVYRLLRAGTVAESGTLGEAHDAYRAWRLAGESEADPLQEARDTVYEGRRDRELARLVTIRREHIDADMARRIVTRACDRMEALFNELPGHVDAAVELDAATMKGVEEGAKLLRDWVNDVRRGRGL